MSTEIECYNKALEDNYKKCKNKSCENCVYTCKEDKHWYCDDWRYVGDNNPSLNIICFGCTKNCTYR